MSTEQNGVLITVSVENIVCSSEQDYLVVEVSVKNTLEETVGVSSRNNFAHVLINDNSPYATSVDSLLRFREFAPNEVQTELLNISLEYAPEGTYTVTVKPDFTVEAGGVETPVQIEILFDIIVT